jgi:hypothetical protein
MRATPFPSITIELPDDILEEHDDGVASYWKKDAECLLQISSHVRVDDKPQVSALERLAERTRTGNGWRPFNLPCEITHCETAAALTTNETGASWVHVYLVWRWVAVYITVSRAGDPATCDWAWDAVSSIQPVVM